MLLGSLRFENGTVFVLETDVDFSAHVLMYPIEYALANATGSVLIVHLGGVS
jgi:hypothetical protein